MNNLETSLVEVKHQIIPVDCLSIEEEAKEIIIKFGIFEQEDMSLVEVHTKNWVEFGKLIIKHRGKGGE